MKAPHQVDVDKQVHDGIEYIGKATRQPDGKYVSLANVSGMLALVECTLHFEGICTPCGFSFEECECRCFARGED